MRFLPAVAADDAWGVVDGGTNTVRLLVARRAGASLARIEDRQEITRVGQGMEASGRIGRGPWLRTRRVILEYAASLRRIPAGNRLIALTGAYRKASNGPSLAARIARDSGCRTVVLTGEQEALLTARGVAAGLPGLDRPAAVLDLGGSSLEVILLSTDGGTAAPVSLDVGVVTLTERFLRGDPPAPAEVEALRRRLRAALGPTLAPLAGTVRTVVATAGTATTLAAVDLTLDDYDPERIQGHVLTRRRVGELLDAMLGMTTDQRRGVAGMDPGREDILPAGTAVLAEAMDLLGAGVLTVADWGLREGLLLALSEGGI